jgi:hypothetical protein
MPLDAYVDAHRVDPATATAWLVAIGFPVVQRLTTWPEPLSHEGHSYTPSALTVDGVAFDGIDTAAVKGSLRIGAGDDYWPTLIAALAEDEQHPEVTVYEAWFNPVTLSPTPETIRTIGLFRLEASEVTDVEVRLTLTAAADPNLARVPSREYGTGLCTYRVPGGEQCGAAAAAAGCARTPAACAGFSNSARFGGFLSLPGETATLTWVWQSGDQLYEETLTLTRREA